MFKQKVTGLIYKIQPNENEISEENNFIFLTYKSIIFFFRKYNPESFSGVVRGELMGLEGKEKGCMVHS